MRSRSLISSVCILVIIIGFLVLSVAGSFPKAEENVNESIYLNYIVKISNNWIILINKKYYSSQCQDGLPWNVSIRVTTNTTTKEQVVNASLIALVMPRQFQVNVTMQRTGVYPRFNIEILASNAELIGIKLRVIYYPNGTHHIVASNTRALCRIDNLTIRYTLRFLGGVVPLTVYDGVESVNNVGVFYAQPLVKSTYVTFYDLSNIFTSVSVFAGSSWVKASVGPNILVLPPPPGREYKYDSLHFSASETVAPGSPPSGVNSSLVLRGVLDVLSTEGLHFVKHSLVNPINNMKLYYYTTTIIKNNNYTVILNLNPSMISLGRASSYNPLYLADKGFLLQLDASGLAAFSAIHSLIDDSFYIVNGYPYPMGGQLDFHTQSLSNLPQAIVNWEENLSRNLTLYISLTHTNYTPENTITVTPNKGHANTALTITTQPNNATVNTHYYEAAAAAILTVLAVLTYYRRRRHGR